MLPMVNPFATRYTRPGAIPFLFPEGGSLQRLLEQLAVQGHWGQIIGPHGSGKSTLLTQLVSELTKAGQQVFVITLHQGERRPPAWPPPAGTQVVAIDGYEQLGWLWRWRVKVWCRRHASGLLVTAHRNVGLPTLWTTTPDLATLRRVVDHLWATVLRDASAGQAVADASSSNDELAAALAAAQGNLREALFHLYDLYQQRSLAASAAGAPPADARE